MQQTDIKSFQNTLTEGRSIAVLLPVNPQLDPLAAALALKLSLEEWNKETTIVCSTPMLVEFNRLVGVNKVASSLDNKNLAISLKDYDAEKVEKVSYNVDNNVFTLIVAPKASEKPPRKDQVILSYQGAQEDVVIVVGAESKESLGRLGQNQDLWNQNTKVCVLGNLPSSGFQNPTELINPEKSSVCEVVFEIVESLGLPINKDISGNLLSGIRAATKNFQVGINAETFSAASRLIKSGAGQEPGAVLQFRPQADKQEGSQNWQEPEPEKSQTLL